MLTINRKKIHSAEVDSEGTWAISYGDMITLLLAFFVMFFTVDPVKEKEQQLTETLVTSLSAMQGESSKDRPAEKLNIGEDPGTGIESRLIQKWGAEVYEVGHKLIIDFPGVSFYDLGNIDVNNEGAAVLNEFAKRYTPFAGKYVLGIRAYTDTRPIMYKRRYKDNLELSALRSVAAMRTLRKAGIPLDRMTLGGYGELKMTMDELKNKSREKYNDDALAVARRVVLVIEPELKKEM